MEDTYDYAENCHCLWFCFTLMELVGRIDIAAKRNHSDSGMSASTSYDGKTGLLQITIESSGKTETFFIRPYQFAYAKVVDIKKRLYEILDQVQGKETDIEAERCLCQLRKFERNKQHKEITT